LALNDTLTDVATRDPPEIPCVLVAYDGLLHQRNTVAVIKLQRSSIPAKKKKATQ
jgi:hypothetical protein